jgi:hypothetical protein
MATAVLRLLPVIGLVCLASTASAGERTAPVHDEAGLFHADAVARAEELIDAVHREYEVRVFVDTVKSASPHERKLFRFLWTREVNRILETQAQTRARDAGVDGIYIVICNDPRDVHVVAPDNAPAFTRHDAETLRRTIVRRLQDSGPDPALLALVEQVRALLHAHAMRGRSTSVVSELVLAGMVGGGAALWLLLCGVRYKMRGGRLLSAIEGSSSEGSRRTPAMLGAMFGSPAGQWIYDKLYPESPVIPPVVPEPRPTVVTEGEEAEKPEGIGPTVEERPEDAPVSP